MLWSPDSVEICFALRPARAKALESRTDPMAAKRNYHRRSDNELISEMENKIQELRKKIEARARPDQDVLNEVPKLQKKLRAFAQLAMQHGRSDIANSTMAFMAGLDRMKNDEPDNPRARRNGES